MPFSSLVSPAKTSVGAILAVLLLLVSLTGKCKVLAQVPTPAPTFACPNELGAWGQCLLGQGLDQTAIQGCVRCSTAWASSATGTPSCPELTTLVCDAVDSCASSCASGSCDSNFLDWITCLSNDSQECFTGCSSVPTAPTAPVPAPSNGGGTPSAPAPAPSSSDPCEEENAAFATCVRGAGSADECVACLEGSEQVTSCDQLEAKTCSIETACPSCGSCLEEYIAANDCVNEGVCDPITCSPTAPSPTSGGTTPTTVAPASASAPASAPASSPVTAPTPVTTPAPVGAEPTPVTTPAPVGTRPTPDTPPSSPTKPSPDTPPSPFQPTPPKTSGSGESLSLRPLVRWVGAVAVAAGVQAVVA